MDLAAAARRHWWSAIIVAIATATVVVVVIMLAKLGAASQQLAQQSKAISLLSTGLSDAQGQLKANGITPKQPPPAQIIAQAGPPGPPGIQGPGPSDTQVQAAEQAYLIAHPIAGQPPTDAQVAAVVPV